MNEKAKLDEWVKMEFEQNFNHLRDRDAILLSITKFYMGLLCSFAGFSGVLLGIDSLSYKIEIVGSLFILLSIIGLITLLWICAIRTYFVKSARQLNGIRCYLTQNFSEKDKKKYVVQPLNSNKPANWNIKSFHMHLIIMIAVINIMAVTIGYILIVFPLNNWAKIIGLIITCLGFIVLSILFPINLLKESANGKE